ncbi:phytoene/squalene synthase family protein [Sphingomonas naphthae]|uniref:Phytoene/squalene synthase family protein n=1 Tax=Sphingomonas naphthae TaxID=1813468 RepID=A0ABY7TKG6_9SPHN|nr:phytoene/squalene synthase family protein [Sphingomonas naphthae]WCT73271.1 phytoene/squalene synthase family protein [Sphingomonas naphthae]
MDRPQRALTPLPDRTWLVAQARDSIARGSKSFAMASRLFDRATRERAWMLYAWCRACDDLADGQDLGMERHVVADPHARLAEIRERTTTALAGGATGDPAFDALAQVVAECDLPARYAWDLVEGFVLDTEGFQPQSEADMLRYCYHVAGSVGVMMAIVMGVDPADQLTLDRACDLGLAFQLANIARDIGEDAAFGRCYLPADWLAEAGIADVAAILDPANADAVGALGQRLGAMAEHYERSARRGTPALARRPAWAVLSAAGIYGDIARRVRWRGADALLNRVVTSGEEKLAWVIKAGLQTLGRRALYPDRPRVGLWTRPR